MGSLTCRLGSFAANPWELHDMHGNVCEWTQDCWKDSYTGAPDNGTARTDGDCSRHIVRGGSWFDRAYWLYSAARYGNTRDVRSKIDGFRLTKSR